MAITTQTCTSSCHYHATVSLQLPILFVDLQGNNIPHFTGLILAGSLALGTCKALRFRVTPSDKVITAYPLQDSLKRKSQRGLRANWGLIEAQHAFQHATGKSEHAVTKSEHDVASANRSATYHVMLLQDDLLQIHSRRAALLNSVHARTHTHTQYATSATVRWT